MKILSTIIPLLAVQGSSALSLRGEAGATSRGLSKTAKLQLQGKKAGGMGMMVRLLSSISREESNHDHQ